MAALMTISTQMTVDEDGVADMIDACPNAQETWNQFQDDDGCPDVVSQSFIVDTDSDRIHDIDDSCPLVAENYNGYQDEDGCPDSDETQPDADGDGVPDVHGYVSRTRRSLEQICRS